MRRQRKRARAPARTLRSRPGDTNQFLGPDVIRLELGLVKRPVSEDTEAGPHLHRFGMEAVRLACEM